MAKRVRVSGYARITRKPSGTVVVTKVKPYRRQPPKEEEQMSTSDRTHDPLGIGPRLRDLDTLLRENDRLRAEIERLQAAEREALRVLGAVVYYYGGGQVTLSEGALNDEYTVERTPNMVAAGVRFKAWPTARHAP